MTPGGRKHRPAFGNEQRERKRSSLEGARRAAVLLCLSASSACTLGPDYARPIVETPPEYRFDEPALAASGLVNGPAWWTASATNTLNQLIREGVANNRDLTHRNRARR